MSDINIIPDGMIAFLAAAILSILLLLGILVCSIYGLAVASRKKERFTRQSVMPHIFGMLLGLVGSIIIILLLFLTDFMPRLRALNSWLDNWIWLWAAALLLMWPLGFFLWRKRAASRAL
jgi:hypothetical protein